MIRINAFLFALAAAHAADLAPVISRPAARTVDLPAEILPYLSVGIHARIAGYVDRVLVDRGSIVRQGDLLAQLSAPELRAQIAEAESQVLTMEAERLQAQAQLAAAQSTFDGLKKASETPGAIAGNELIQAEKQVEAARAAVGSREQAMKAAQAAVQARKDLEAYLRITAPFDGVVTDRLVHPGALAGPPDDPVLLTIQQISRLRVVVPVPEEYTGAIAPGAVVPFRVPAFPARVYSGTVARSAHALDPKSRTMAVELDVVNRDGSLAPGMFPAVQWPVRPGHAALFVPKTSVVTTTERTFVIRDRGGRAEWVDVKKVAADGDLVEVLGALHPGDRVLRRATDEVRDGSALPQ
jgi:membrane fusion protein, multidrug efflux system